MQALVEAGLPVSAVLSNRADAKGLEFARRRGIAAAVVEHGSFAHREAFEQALAREIDRFAPRLVALAGFMRVLTPYFVNAWQGRLINIHPSLLPKYPGINTHSRALEAGDLEHGCTVHLVVEEVDSGEILGQAKMPIRPEDTAETLAERVLTLEHELYPRCLEKLARSL
jgi:phosphoribosylglycinamide formyltransferase-1